MRDDDRRGDRERGPGDSASDHRATPSARAEGRIVGTDPTPPGRLSECDPRHNLPAQLTSFVGREREGAEVARLLANTRLVTLIGAPGVGKTRLALRVAADLIGSHPGGVWWAELAALADPALVPQAVAAALGVREQPGGMLPDTLAAILRPRQLLLVLDNCEHLVEACAALADGLLRACPRLHILATSREPLGIAGETTWLVPSLSFPDATRAPVVDDPGQYEAVRLFAERARAALPGFALSDQNAGAVVQICRRLDGIPLAIELAAARVRGLSVGQIADRLDDRFSLLSGGSRAALPRQRTLRALVDWSHALLSEPERVLLRRLSVFAGGWTLEAAEAICAGGATGADEVVGLLLHLVDKSLVVVEGREGRARYRLLETIREYGGQRLREAGEEAAVRGRHRDWFLQFAEDTWPELHGPAQGAWLARLEDEHDNFRAALAWSEAEPGGAEASLRLAGALYRFWWRRGYLSEGRAWLRRALERDARHCARARGRALNAAGVLARAQAGEGPARGLFEDSLALFREHGSRWELANALHNLGSVVLWQGDDGRAAALMDESLALWRARGDPWGIAMALSGLGDLAWWRGDLGRATVLQEESLALLRAVGDTWGIAATLGDLAILAREQGDHTRAGMLLEQCLALQRDLGDLQRVSWALDVMGRVAGDRGDFDQATALHRESLVLARDLGATWRIIECLEGLAQVAGATEQPERSARLYGAAHALREACGTPAPPPERAEHERDLASARARLG